MSERPGQPGTDLELSREHPRSVEWNEEFPDGIEDAVVVEDDSETDPGPNQTPEISAENPNAAAARESLLVTHALRQSALEAVTTGVEAFTNVINTAQNIRSAAHSFRLRAQQSRSQRRLERQTNIAENSMFAFRRRKFAQKAEATRHELEDRTALVDAHDTFLETRQAFRDLRTNERSKRVENNREFLTKQSLIARERRQRRRDLLEGFFTLRDDRREEILRKRRDQLPMVQFRQALFTNIEAT